MRVRASLVALAGAFLLGWANRPGGDVQVVRITTLGSARAPVLQQDGPRITLLVETDGAVAALDYSEGRLEDARAASASEGRAARSFVRLEEEEAASRAVSSPFQRGGLFLEDGVRRGWTGARQRDAAGDEHLAWDRHQSGDYDVVYRGPDGREEVVAGSAKAEFHPSLAIDRLDRVWLAWDEGMERWGQRDFLRREMRLRLAVRTDGLWRTAKLPPYLEGDDAPLAELPRLQADASGVVWLLWRQMDTWKSEAGSGPPVHVGWTVRAAAWTGTGWTPPVELPDSDGPGHDTVAALPLPGGGLLVACESDARVGIEPAQQAGPACYAAPSEVQVYLLRAAADAGADAPAGSELATGRTAPPTPPVPGDPDPGLVPEGYVRLWGDLHRHSDLSRCAAAEDGTVFDQYRYALDAARLDFLAVTDHHSHMTPDAWALNRAAVEAFDRPHELLTLYGFERILESSHRNFVCIDPEQAADAPFRGDPEDVFAGYPAGQWVAIPHQLTDPKHTFVWTVHDPGIETAVELYQARRGGYESVAGPRRDLTALEGYPHVRAYLREGKRFGFVAASDHTANARAFTAVLARDRTREALFDALRARRLVAATARMALDVRLGELVIGEAGPAAADTPLQVRAAAGGEIARIEVLRRGRVVHQWAGADPRQGLLTVRYGRQNGRRRLVVDLEQAEAGDPVPLVLEDDDALVRGPEGRVELDLRLRSNDTDGVVVPVRWSDRAAVNVRAGRPSARWSFDELRSGPVRRKLSGAWLELRLDPAPLGGERFEGTWEPGDWKAGDWVYVRLVRTDGEVAWSSPIWIDAP